MGAIFFPWQHWDWESSTEVTVYADFIDFLINMKQSNIFLIKLLPRFSCVEFLHGSSMKQITEMCYKSRKAR